MTSFDVYGDQVELIALVYVSLEKWNCILLLSLLVLLIKLYDYLILSFL